MSIVRAASLYFRLFGHGFILHMRAYREHSSIPVSLAFKRPHQHRLDVDQTELVKHRGKLLYYLITKLKIQIMFEPGCDMIEHMSALIDRFILNFKA